MKIERFTDRQAWLANRRSGIGGSDAGPILGLSPWKTPLQVWSAKCGLVEDDETTYSMRRGNALEEFIANELEREAGIVLFERFGASNPVIVTHPDYPCLRYSPDAFACSVQTDPFKVEALGEFKARMPWAKDDWAEGIPADVNAQVQLGMDVCDLPAAYVAVDLGSECRWARVERDTAWMDENRPKLLAFWKLVETEEPPPPTGDDKDVLKKLYPRATGETVALPPEYLDEAWELDGINEMLREAKERKDAIEAKFQAFLGERQHGVLPDGSRVSWTNVKGSTYTVTKPPSRQFRRTPRKEK